MEKQRYTLIDEKRRQNAIEHIRGLDISEKLEVVIQPHKAKRSLSQNALYWKWLEYFAKYTGYTIDETHEVFKLKYLGISRRMIKDTELVELRSTTKLKVKEFTEYLNKIERFAVECDIHLPHPDDYKFAMYGEKL